MECSDICEPTSMRNPQNWSWMHLRRGSQGLLRGTHSFLTESHSIRTAPLCYGSDTSWAVQTLAQARSPPPWEPPHAHSFRHIRGFSNAQVQLGCGLKPSVEFG